jgi:hypothetical protein
MTDGGALSLPDEAEDRISFLWHGGDDPDGFHFA